MSARRLLYLDQQHLAVYAWQGGKLLPNGLFASTTDGQRQFVSYLREHRSNTFSLLANVADEVQHLENIPYLRGRDRQTLLQRKIIQHFPGTALTAAISLGQESGQRKNEKILLSALTDPAHLAPWLRCLNEAAAPLAGIFTLSQLGGPLLKKLGHGRERCLLLTQQDDSLRESYIVDGQTLFSRRVPLTDLSSPALARSFAAEASTLQHYLIGQRLIGRDESLSVFIIAHPRDLPAISETTAASGQLRYTLLDNARIAADIGLLPPPADSRSDALFLHLLASAPPRQQFASPAHRHDFHLAKIRRSLSAASLIVLLLSALFSSMQIAKIRDWTNQTQQLLTAEAELKKSVPAIASNTAPLDIAPEAFRNLARRHAELRRQQRSPGSAFAVLSKAVEQTPAIQLDKLAWKMSHSGPSTATGIDGDAETLTVSGNIHSDSTANQRQILGTLEEFIEKLRRNPATTIKIVRSPVDIDSGRTVLGGDRDVNSARSIQFVIELTQKLLP